MRIQGKEEGVGSLLLAEKLIFSFCMSKYAGKAAVWLLAGR